MKVVAVLLGLTVSTFAQQNNCYWNFTLHDGTVFELDLSNFTGEIYRQSDENENFLYSMCSNKIQCTNQGTTVYDMVSAFPQGVIECRNMAAWQNGQNRPRYDFGHASWRFNFTNGAKCAHTGQNYEILIFFDCHPGATRPYFDKLYRFNECGYAMQFQFAGACEPVTPANEACKFNAYPNTNLTLDLSSLKGKDISVTNTGNGPSWHYTPCANALRCEFPNGNSIDTMAQLEDSVNNCAKFLGLWSGDVEPHYFKNSNGLDTWSFSWFDGMECDEGDPPEHFEVFYVCDPTVDTYKVNATSVHRCHFSMEILTSLACASS